MWGTQNINNWKSKMKRYLEKEDGLHRGGQGRQLGPTVG